MMLQGCLLLSHKSICHNFISPYQKQQFADVIQNRYFQKFHNVHRKAIVLEPPFNKVAGLQDRFISMNIAKFLRTAFIYRTPLMAAFVPFLLPPHHPDTGCKLNIIRRSEPGRPLKVFYAKSICAFYSRCIVAYYRKIAFHQQFNYAPSATH